jgi:hypothetical protein
MTILIRKANPASVWQHYKLINVQWPEKLDDKIPFPAIVKLPSGDPGFATLMNPVLETFVQSEGTSCLGCRDFAGLAQQQSPRPASSYSFMFSYAQSPPPPAPKR